MRDNLHKFIINDPCFPENIEQAVHNGCLAADRSFLGQCLRDTILEDISGTCACIVFFVEETIYVVNIGDSRSVLSAEGGKKVEDLTVDHKPNSRSEKSRILAASGKIYKYKILRIEVPTKM